MAQKEHDALTGTETTGHEWDGIKELNTPLPRWWVYLLWVTVIWAVVYYVLYPSWPIGLGDYTKGVLGYSSRAELAKELEAVKQSRAGWLQRFEDSTVEEVAGDPDLLNYAMAGGRVIFADNCAPCHGSGGQGAPAYPVLADDDWIWGGTLEDILFTIRYGVRATHDETRLSEMPNFLADEIITAEEAGEVTDYVMSLTGAGVATVAGQTVFMEQCAACHGEDGKGLKELGGPNLADGIWLYGEGRDAVMAQLGNPRHGEMPAWVGRLDDVSIKQVTVYVHSLGGGQ